MRRQRTTPILVTAILHLVGGGIGLLTSICGVGGLLMADSLSSFTPPTMPARPGQPPPPNLPTANDLMKQLSDQVPGYRAFTIGTLVMSFVLDFMLLTAGIGLLTMQPWARWLSLAYAPLSIVNRIGASIYQLVWVVPATQAVYAKATMPPGFSSIMAVASGIGVFLSLLLVLYPIAVLIVMLMPSTATAFRGEMPVREVGEDLAEVEEDDDEPWRQPPPRSDKFRQ